MPKRMKRQGQIYTCCSELCLGHRRLSMGSILGIGRFMLLTLTFKIPHAFTARSSCRQILLARQKQDPII